MLEEIDACEVGHYSAPYLLWVAGGFFFMGVWAFFAGSDKGGAIFAMLFGALGAVAYFLLRRTKIVIHAGETEMRLDVVHNSIRESVKLIDAIEKAKDDRLRTIRL